MNRLNGSSLKAIREFYGKNQSYFAKELGISQPTMSKIEKGEKPLEHEHIKLFSEYFTEKFFQNTHETAPQQLYYRKLSSINKTTINLFESRINLIYGAIKKGLDIVDLESDSKGLPRIDPEQFNLDFEYIATEIRLRLGIGRGPILNIIEVLEAYGVFIHFFEYDFISEENRKFDGVSFYADGAPVILINKKIPDSRKVFTIAHELGHLIMHFDSIINMERDIEKEANKFAAAFLAPEKDIKKDLRQLTLAKLEALKLEWNMSISALVYRAYTLQTISDQTLRWWMMKLAPIRKNEPHEFKLPAPALMSEMIKLLNEETDHGFFNDLGYTPKLQQELFNINHNTSKLKLKIVN